MTLEGLVEEWGYVAVLVGTFLEGRRVQLEEGRASGKGRRG